MNGEIEETQTEGEPTPERPEDQPAPTEPSPEEEEHEHEQHEQEQSAPEPEEHEASAASEQDIEGAFKKLERSATNWRNRVSELLGEGAQLLHVCPLCEPAIPGFVMQSPETPERFPAVLAFMGVSAEPELEDDPDSHQCQTCKGWGKVATGSRTEANKAMVCRTCRGNGAVGPRFEQAAPPVFSSAGPGEQNGPTSPTLTPDEQAQVEALRRKGVVVIPPAAPAAV